MIGWLVVGIAVGVLLTPATVALVLTLDRWRTRRLDLYAGRDTTNREST